jgi:uncharacterized protein YoxC
MIMIISSAVLPPIQSSAPDTVAVLAAQGLLPTVEAISMIVLGVAILAVLTALLLVLLQLRKASHTLTTLAGKVEKEATPVLDRARSVAENVEFITMAVRTDVEKITASVAGLNDRLREASNRMEERIQDFNALVDVLQGEAEEMALDTAAAVRGVRAGTRNLAGESQDRPPREMPAASKVPASQEPYSFPAPEPEGEEEN